MLSKLRIGPRLIFLIAVQGCVLLAIGATALAGLNLAAGYTDSLNRTVSEGTRLGYIAETVRADFIGTLRAVNAGTMDWKEGGGRLQFARRQFEDDWARFSSSLTADEAEFADDVLAPGLADVRQAFSLLTTVLEAEDREALAKFVSEDLNVLVEPFLNALLASSTERQMSSEKTFAESLKDNQIFLYTSLGVIIVGVILAGVLGFFIYRSISAPIGQISDTVPAGVE